MNDIGSLAVSLIRSELCAETSEETSETFPEQLDPDLLSRLYVFSAGHDLAHVVGAALYRRRLLSSGPWADRYKNVQALALCRYEQTAHELHRLSACLESGQIEHIPLKGSALRLFYPRPEMRTSCDIDILIHPELLDRAVALLTDKLSYRKTTTGPHDVQLFSPAGIHLELHFALIEEKRYPQLHAVLSRIWSFSRPVEGRLWQRELLPEMLYFYHMAHMVKHFSAGGCGIRSVMDLWVLTHRIMDAEASKQADVLLAEGGILTFAIAAKHLAEVWFSGAAPDALTLDMQEFIFAGSAYGNAENRVKLGCTKKKGNFRYLLSRLFLPYDELKYKYPILQKHKLLLPVYEIRRWFLLTSRTTSRRIGRELRISREITPQNQRAVQNLLDRLELR